MAKAVVKPGRAGKFVGGQRVLGTTRDGVHILKPKGPATHFTAKEIREAVASVVAARRAG